ncbi:MAG: hypothetical protein HY819_03470 [Acidobacteria bacterium]|nr:hypothetical protein [Acidobacteriota bacterium]
MMKITSESNDKSITVKLEGALTRDWVKELLLFWQESFICEKKRYRQIDLRNVTFIDAEGKALLTLLYQNGAELLADSLLIKAIVEEIKLKGKKE